MYYRKRLKKVLEDKVIDEMSIIENQLQITMIYTILNNLNVYIWAENELPTYVRLFKSYGINVKKVVSIFNNNIRQIDDVEVISPDELKQDRTENKFFFLVPLEYASINGIEKFLKEHIEIAGTVGSYSLNRFEMQVILSVTTAEFDLNRIYYYQSHKEELLHFCDTLVDEKSKEVLIAYVKSYMSNQPYVGEQIPAVYKYFFGSKNEILYRHLDDECWINCGSSVGDTIFCYFRWNFNAKKIYAFEGDPNTFKTLINNLNMLVNCKREVANILQPINAMIDEHTDFDRILNGNRCTLLNADIEGNELKLLKAMEHVIVKDRPVISICMYHLKEDLVVIPQYLQSILDDYVYCLRKYTPFVGNTKRNHELVMYAIPKERSLIDDD